MTSSVTLCAQNSAIHRRVSWDATMSCIRYKNAENTVLLIDVPLSIMLAQGAPAFIAKHALLSSEPRTQPYPVLNEPSAQLSNTGDQAYHENIIANVREAIDEIKAGYKGPWCGPRKWPFTAAGCAGASSKKQRKRSAAEMHTEAQCDNATAAVDDMAAAVWRMRSMHHTDHSQRQAICALSGTQPTPSLAEDRGGIVVTRENSLDVHQAADIYNRPLRNAIGEVVELRVDAWPESSNGQGALRNFHLPSDSTFLLSRIEDSVATFKRATACRLWSSTACGAGPGQFDFILLDPPWPNASAKRARAYDRHRSVHDTIELLRSMRLEEHIAPAGFVAVWITNKPKIRRLLVAQEEDAAPSRRNIPASASASASSPPPSHPPDSVELEQYRGMATLFEHWGLTLVEEWVWIKTTTVGEPLTDLQSVWRKPYEILLIGRSQQQPASKTRQRVIAGVPDLHSRKPSLKEPVESYLLRRHAPPPPPSPLPLPLLSPHDNEKRASYRALEIFARHLTHGWWAWGDEVLKFNWDAAWTKLE